MTIHETSSPAWKAPVGDGEILIWPDPQTLVHQSRENHRLLWSATPGVQNLPACELRRHARQWIGHAEEAQPLIGTGHQVELIHAGVWAKDVLINVLANRLSGSAAHFAVDTDAPKHLQLRFPGDSLPITDDPVLRTADWCGLLEAPTPAHLKHLETTFAKASAAWPFRPVLRDFFTCLGQLIPEAADLIAPLTQAMHQLDGSLGLRHHLFLASAVWQSPAYLAFAHHILARAESFSQAYNSTLCAYRREQGIRNPGRPWPDLRSDPDCCEVPFWLDLVGQSSRHRACIVRIGNQWVLRLPGHADFPLDPSAEAFAAADELGRFLGSQRARLSPRALTLTAFIRLFLVDQFVHGIGGGRYDRITDRVIATWFGIVPPAFSVTTATLFLPFASSQPRVDVHGLLTAGRRLRHGWSDPEKMRLVRAIAGTPRKSLERQSLFHELHRRLTEQLDRGAYKEWQRRLDGARKLAHDQQDVFDRELFYAIQPQDRLGSLITRYNAEF